MARDRGAERIKKERERRKGQSEQERDAEKQAGDC